MSVNPTHINTQSGNVLIYILGAIVLIGLLTIMVKGSSTPGSNIDREALEIRVAEVQQYGNELERAVTYILRNGYSETDIRFAHPNHSSLYGDITDDPARQIFAREGGGATWRDNETDIQTTDTDWVFNAHNMLQGSGTTAAANVTTSDLIAFLPNVSEDFCKLINKKNDIIPTVSDPPMDCGNVDVVTPFIGDFSYLNQLLDGTGCGEAEILFGKTEGCFTKQANPFSGNYMYYRVLLAR